MRKLIAITQVTLDGVMQSPGGPEATQFFEARIRPILAANCYDCHTEEQLGGLRLDSREAMLKGGTRGPAIVPGDPDHSLLIAAVRQAGDLKMPKGGRLKASDGRALHIWGSSELLQTLIAADLVDEYRLWVFPVVLGQGKRLFENGVPPRGLSLVATRSTPRGILLNTYRPAGPLPKV